MQAVILAGGLGTRIAEETSVKPKPMVEIGGMPILWHIMKIYSAHGINDFIICLGYKGYVIKEFFFNYYFHSSDVTIELDSNSIEVHAKRSESWRVTLVNTGDNTNTGGRLRRVADYIQGEDFCFTYGDGVADINITKLIAFHRDQKKYLATVTAVAPPARFGLLQTKGRTVEGFSEKVDHTNAQINGGFFVLNKKVIDYIEHDNTSWEREPLERLAAEGVLQAFLHTGFWQPMDTVREKNVLNELWESGDAPWKIW
jgi:glucose-1-phosphate cytidylyltransferase